jgi:hypothetical protein
LSDTKGYRNSDLQRNRAKFPCRMLAAMALAAA